MASAPAGKKPASPKATRKPVARKKAAGAATPKKRVAAPAKTTTPKKPVKAKAVPGPQVVATTPEILEPRQQRFVDEYLIDLNATQAAIRAGYSEKTAAVIGSENLTKPNIQAAIAKAQDERARRTGIDGDKALAAVWAIAVADARELVQVKVGCCRHCYGEGFRYQRTVGEMNHDREAHAAKGADLADFDEKGGIGFDPLRMPNDQCPECGGDGHARTVLGDTRRLSPQAAALYAGAKPTKYGIEVQMHSKMDAMEKVFKHLGLYQRDNSQKVDPLTSLLHTIAGGNNSAFKPVARDPDHDEG